MTNSFSTLDEQILLYSWFWAYVHFPTRAVLGKSTAAAAAAAERGSTEVGDNWLFEKY